MCLAAGGEEIFPQLETICRAELGWDKQQWEAELERYKTIWQRFYYFDA
jgi:glycerol-3-phosphate dehydrogenase